jgi:spermidine synthase
MGIGTLASYARAGDYFRFYEIDSAVAQLSLGPRPYFQFLKDSAASIDLVMGDGRLSLEREAARGDLQRFDILAADAFSADAVPAHLLTREAMGIYLQHVRRGGVLAFNISNRFLDLAPVIAGLAKAFRLNAVQVRDQYSIWILLSQDSEIFRTPDLKRRETSIVLAREPLLWSDDYSNLFAVLRRQQLALR